MGNTSSISQSHVRSSSYNSYTPSSSSSNTHTHHNGLHKLSKKSSTNTSFSTSTNHKSSLSSMFGNFFSSILSLGKSNKKNKLGMHSNASVTDFAMPSASTEEVASQQKLRRTQSLPAHIGGNSPHSYHSIMQPPHRAFSVDAGSVYAEEKKSKMTYSDKDWGSFLSDAGHNPDYQDKHFKAAREAKAKPVSPEVNPYKDNDIDKIIEHTGGDLDKLDSMFGLYTGVEKRK